MSATGNVRVRESYCVPSKIFYINGMIAPLDDAQAHADEIQRIASAEVELHYNDTTPKDITVAMVVKTLAGAVLLGGAVGYKKKTSREKKVAIVVGAVGVGLICSALYDYNQIQNKKNESAQQLASKVVRHLKDPSRLGNVILILHSQGADIGIRAIERLQDYKDRIDVITIGGMVDIPNEFANRVVNFVDEKDMIARFAKGLFGTLSHIAISLPVTYTNQVTKNKDCKTPFCHGSSDHFRVSDIQEVIAELCKPKTLSW